MQQCCQWGMLCRHTSGLEHVLNKILRKSLKELPLHWVLIRGLYHVTCMMLEFIIECQCSLTTRGLSSSVTICCILCSKFMYKGFIHAAYEVFKVPFPGPLIPSLNFICVPGRSETGKGSSTKIYSYGPQSCYTLGTNRVIHSTRYQIPWCHPHQSISLVGMP